MPWYESAQLHDYTASPYRRPPLSQRSSRPASAGEEAALLYDSRMLAARTRRRIQSGDVRLERALAKVRVPDYAVGRGRRARERSALIFTAV